MKFVIATVLACSLLPGTALAQAKRPAPNTYIDGCVINIDAGFDERGTVRLSVTVARQGTPFRLTPTGFIHSSSGGPQLTLAQMGLWAPVLDMLRDSGKNKFEVRFEVDSATRKVEYVRAHYYKPCK